MNPYLIALITYAAMIAPLTASLDARLGKRSWYRLRLLAIGIPMRQQRLRVLLRRRSVLIQEEGLFREKTEERQIELRRVNPVVIRALLSPKFLRMLFSGLDLRRLHVRARIATADAARTALLYALATTLLRVVQRLSKRKLHEQISIEADFSGTGTRVVASGIITVRLGRLLLAAAMAGVLITEGMIRKAAKDHAKEKPYAAASH